MKINHILLIVLLVLLLAACGTQNGTNEPGEVTVMPTPVTGGETPNLGTSEAAATPTGSSGGDTSNPYTGYTDMTPTVPATGSTPAPGSGGTAVIPQTGLGDATDEIEKMIRELREFGAAVEFDNTAAQDLFPVPGQRLRINGEEVQVYIFDSLETLELQADTIAEDGASIGTTMVTWEGSPHFYKLGRMLVLYVGNDPQVRALLEDVVGPQFAGQ